MEQEIMRAEKERFNLINSNQYLIQGTWKEGYLPKIFLDKEPVNEIQLSLNGEEIESGILLPENAGQYKKLSVYAERGETKVLWYSE